MGEKVQGLRSINWWVQSGQGGVKNSTGNVKPNICTTYGYGLRGVGYYWTEGGYWVQGGKGEKLGQL